MKQNLHTHSIFCDGKDTIEERKDAHILGSPIPIKDIKEKYKTKK